MNLLEQLQCVCHIKRNRQGVPVRKHGRSRFGSGQGKFTHMRHQVKGIKQGRRYPDATPDRAPLPEASTHRRDISPAQARVWLGSVPCSHVRGAARSSASRPDSARASHSMSPTAGSRPSMLSSVSYSSTSFANLRNFRRSYFRWSSVGVGADYSWTEYLLSDLIVQSPADEPSLPDEPHHPSAHPCSGDSRDGEDDDIPFPDFQEIAVSEAFSFPPPPSVCPRPGPRGQSLPAASVV